MDLATRALSDETDRVNAGVDDNLPLVTAQATLAAAQSNMVESLYQYNLSKLALARAAGIIEQQYRVYLGAMRLAPDALTCRSELADKRKVDIDFFGNLEDEDAGIFQAPFHIGYGEVGFGSAGSALNMNLHGHGKVVRRAMQRKDT